jgi:acyl carrier protein
MTVDDIRTTLMNELKRIAPESNPASIAATANLREELDLDSMDFLNLVLALHDRLGMDIPEAHYSRLATLEGAIAYLTGRLGVSTTP